MPTREGGLRGETKPASSARAEGPRRGTEEAPVSLTAALTRPMFPEVIEILVH